MNRNKIKILPNLLVVVSLVLTAFLALGGSLPVQANPPSGHGGTFQDADGNLVVDPNPPVAAEVHDWNGPIEPIVCPAAAPGSGTFCGLDLSKSTADNSFGQGSKEDNPVPSVVTGSIPNNKSDLTRFYVNFERSATNDFLLYLAWERANVLGNANMDFEINQLQTPSANGVTPVRTPGDVLITFDFTNGGGNPQLGLLTWLDSTNGTVADCFASNALPCWGDRVDLVAANEAEGAVNALLSVVDTNPPAPAGGNVLPALTFGEVGVDLTESGIFPANKCEHFGSAFLNSRSSASFTSEMKDFIAPVNINISNCGTIVVKKVTVPSPDPTNESFNFSLNGPASPNITLPKTFSLMNGQSNTTQVFANSGYNVAETVPLGWVLTSATCDNGDPVTNITVGLNQTVTCTFTNTAEGTLIVKKVTNPASDTTTVFTFTAGGGLSPTSFTLLNLGSKTYPDLLAGSGYNVSENSIANWDLTSAVCDGTGNTPANITITPGGTVTCTFTNTERGAITIIKKDDAGNLLDGATFVVIDSSNNTDGTCTTVAGTCTISNLVPGVYTVHESVVPTGYDGAADQTVTVGAGATVTVTFVDVRQFTIIVLVCRVSDNSLYASSVTVDGLLKHSLGPGGGGALSDSSLCSLGGAVFTDKHVGDHPGDVAIPN